MSFFGVQLMFAYSPISFQAVEANREALLAVLTKLNITDVIIRYEGGGDSGDVAEVTVMPESLMPQLALEQMTHRHVVTGYSDNQYHYHIEERLLSVNEALHDFALEWVDVHHSGWENNDGGSGTVTIQVANNRFQLEHTEYYTESCGYEYTL